SQGGCIPPPGGPPAGGDTSPCRSSSRCPHASPGTGQTVSRGHRAEQDLGSGEPARRIGAPRQRDHSASPSSGNGCEPRERCLMRTHSPVSKALLRSAAAMLLLGVLAAIGLAQEPGSLPEGRAEQSAEQKNSKEQKESKRNEHQGFGAQLAKETREA